MPEFLTNFFLTKQFIPHGHCYLWKPGLVGLHIISDSLIALAYYSIPVMLVYLLYKRRDVPFPEIFLMFGAFIVACGTTHIMEVWTLWHPTYWLSGAIKAITAIISLYTAWELVPLLPKVLALPSPAQLRAANLALENEILERQRAEQALQKEQEFLKVLLNNVEAGIVACDAQGVLTVFNQATRKFHGLPEQPLPADQWAQYYDLYLPDGKTEMKKEDVPLFRALQEECVSNVEMMIVPKQGTARTLLASGQTLFDRQGKKLGAVVVMHDITERKRAEEQIRSLNAKLEQRVNERTAELRSSNEKLKSEITERLRAEEALRESEEQLRLITDALPVLISYVDSEQCYRFNNRAYEQWFGYSRKEITGQHLRKVLGESAYQTIEGYVKAALSGQEVTYESIVPYKDGGTRYINGNCLPHFGEQGEVKGYIALISDISSRKRAESEIHQLNTQLEQRVMERTAQLTAANEELETFSYSVSHDLRAPLRSIDGFSQALLEGYNDKLDERGQNYLQRVLAATQRMGQLIDDLLNLSKVTRSQMRCEPVALSALAQLIATELLNTQPQRQVEFVIAPELVANGDTRLLRIVLENLLGNAWKFTGKKNRARIEFGLTEHEDTVAYFVRDDGSGFDMTYVDKLFGAFQRLHAMTEFEGTGIGLATVQRIIHRHGGRVWAEGAIEQGATFYFTL
jgi:PAS domain S-box-containing protein